MYADEKTVLFSREGQSKVENCGLMSSHQKGKSSSSSEEDWREESTGTGSSSYTESTSDDSYFANWEDYVSKDGSLFYAEYSKIHYHFIGGCGTSNSYNAFNVMKKDFKRSSTRRSSSNKNKKQSRFMKFLAKHNDEDITKTAEPENKQSSELKENEEERNSLKCKEPNENEENSIIINTVEILINPENRFKFGRRATAVEALLGISIEQYSLDPNKVILSGHMMNSTIVHDKSIKIGDVLLSVNDIEVTAQNINELLENFVEPTQAYIKFQKVINQKEQNTGNDINDSNMLVQLTSFDSFVKESVDILSQQNKQGNSSEMIFSLLMLNEDISNSNEPTDALFCYPALENNVLFKVRGAFLTLNAILKSTLRTEPLSTTVKVDNVQYNVCYTSSNKVLILYSISENYSSLKETKLRLTEFMKYIEFFLLTIDLDMNDSIKRELERICEITNIRLKNSYGITQFETLLQGSKLLPLPKEAQLRIFDALSEMEAMDYRDWNDEPLNSHREFFIFGSALYYRSYLLANQLPVEQLIGVETFLKCRGIFDFIEYQNVRDLIIWVEIPLASESRHFLAISSRNQLLLAVILQAFDPERRISNEGIIQEKIISPSLFYIEEIQETLDYLRHGGIEALARAWISSNKRPQVVNPAEDSNNQNTVAAGASSSGLTGTGVGFTSEEVQLCSSLSPAQSLSHSEDSSNQKLNDCDSDSDWEGFPGSHKSSSGFDMSEITESLLKEVSDVVPTKITAGKENVLVNYIHLDIGSGIIMCPPQMCKSSLTNKFRKACHIIHTILQNTKKFKRILSQESSKPNAHKSLVAIKEHGILISDGEGINKTTYWVIGRLFASPPRELYVCHKSDIPQNLVEMAFRLSFNTAG